VFGDVVHANGVACSADGPHDLTSSDTRRQRIIAFDVERAIRRDIDVSAIGTSDGMHSTSMTALWVALVSGGIARLTPDGDVDRRGSNHRRR